jgi:hypothetical protein
MSGFLFAFLATAIAGIGARDQLMLAGLSARLGQRPGLLAVAVLSAIATAALAAWAALAVMPILAGNAAGGKILTGIALALAGGEMLLFGPRSVPQEPTQSLGATGIVLLAQQLTDAARFVIFALAVATAAPIPAAIGGAAGSVAVVTLGWLAAGDLPQGPVLLARRAGGALLLAIAGVLVLAGRGLV